MVGKGLIFERKNLLSSCDQNAIVVVNRVEPWSLKNIYIEYIYIIILPEEDKLLFESKNTEQIICEIRNNAKVRNIIKVWRNYTKRKGYLDSTYHNNV